MSLCDPIDYSPPELLFLWKSPGKNSRVGYHSRWFPFPTKRLHPVILHCWQILYHLSHQRSLWSVLGFSREWKQIGHKEGEREITEDRGRERDTTLLWLTLSWFTDFVFYTNWRLVANLPQVSYLAPFPNIICLVYVSVSHFGDSAIFKTFYYYYIVMVICHYWSLISDLWCYNHNSLKAQMIVSTFWQ